MSSRLNVTLLGHKDHGKSTLIGRLLFDTGSVKEDRVAEVKATCEARGLVFEYAFLLDAFQEEREDGMTIDVIHAQIKGSRRFYDCIDVPGHRELIKNMLTGASHADAGILIVSAAEGIEEQTGQHIRLAQWLGLDHLVVVVNKLDRVGHAEKAFAQIRDGVRALLGETIGRTTFIPVSALGGENVVRRSPEMPWYEGPTVFEALERLEPRTDDMQRPLRLPVQGVYPGPSGSGPLVVGRIEAGTLKVGQVVRVIPGEGSFVVRDVQGASAGKTEAGVGENVGLALDPAPQTRRGAVVCAADQPVLMATEVVAHAIFLEEIPVRPEIECGTARTTGTFEVLVPAEIGEVCRLKLRLDEPLPVDRSSTSLGRIALKHHGRIVGVAVVS